MSPRGPGGGAPVPIRSPSSAASSRATPREEPSGTFRPSPSPPPRPPNWEIVSEEEKRGRARKGAVPKMCLRPHPPLWEPHLPPPTPLLAWCRLEPTRLPGQADTSPITDNQLPRGTASPVSFPRTPSSHANSPRINACRPPEHPRPAGPPSALTQKPRQVTSRVSLSIRLVTEEEQASQ